MSTQRSGELGERDEVMVEGEHPIVAGHEIEQQVSLRVLARRRQLASEFGDRPVDGDFGLARSDTPERRGLDSGTLGRSSDAGRRPDRRRRDR